MPEAEGFWVLQCERRRKKGSSASEMREEIHVPFLCRQENTANIISAIGAEGDIVIEGKFSCNLKTIEAAAKLQGGLFRRDPNRNNWNRLLSKVTLRADGSSALPLRGSTLPTKEPAQSALFHYCSKFPSCPVLLAERASNQQSTTSGQPPAVRQELQQGASPQSAADLKKTNEELRKDNEALERELQEVRDETERLKKKTTAAKDAEQKHAKLVRRIQKAKGNKVKLKVKLHGLRGALKRCKQEEAAIREILGI